MRLIEYLIKSRYSSLRKFADDCGMCHCTLTHYLSGCRFPNTHNFMSMCDRLGVSAEYLYKNWYKEINENDKKI